MISRAASSSMACLVAVTLCVVGAAMAGPQPPAKRDNPRSDPQARFEPKSAPGAGQKYLAAFVGDWDVAKAFHPREGEPTRTTGTCRQTLIQGGRFLQSDFVFGEGSARTTGTGIIGFEPETGRFTSVWIDSRQTRMSLRQSSEAFDGQAIRLESATAATAGSPPAKEGRRSRTESRVEDGGRRIVHRQYAVEPDGATGRLVMELVLTRKTPAANPSNAR